MLTIVTLLIAVLGALVLINQPHANVDLVR